MYSNYFIEKENILTTLIRDCVVTAVTVTMYLINRVVTQKATLHKTQYSLLID